MAGHLVESAARPLVLAVSVIEHVDEPGPLVRGSPSLRYLAWPMACRRLARVSA